MDVNKIDCIEIKIDDKNKSKTGFLMWLKFRAHTENTFIHAIRFNFEIILKKDSLDHIHRPKLTLKCVTEKVESQKCYPNSWTV